MTTKAGDLSTLLNIAFKPNNYPRTAQQLTYEVLKAAILKGSLTPGTRLTQSELAAALSISTTPVREALRRLAGDGLISIEVHRGAIVQGLDKNDLSETYELRLLLETLSVRKAAPNITAEELNNAENLCTQMDSCSDVDIWSDLNRAFHEVFARAAASPRLDEILRGLRDRSAPFVRRSIAVSAESASVANREHRELVDACRSRDADRAAEVQAKHLRRTLATLLNEPNLAPQPPQGKAS